MWYMWRFADTNVEAQEQQPQMLVPVESTS